jgi:hypothetical protein
MMPGPATWGLDPRFGFQQGTAATWGIPTPDISLGLPDDTEPEPTPEGRSQAAPASGTSILTPEQQTRYQTYVNARAQRQIDEAAATSEQQRAGERREAPPSMQEPVMPTDYVQWGGLPGGVTTAHQTEVDDAARQGIDSRHERNIATIEARAEADDPMKKTLKAAGQNAAFRQLAPIARPLVSNGKRPGTFTQTGTDSFATTPGMTEMTQPEARAIATNPRTLEQQIYAPLEKLEAAISEAEASGNQRLHDSLMAVYTRKLALAKLRLTGLSGRNLGFYGNNSLFSGDQPAPISQPALEDQ